MFLTQFALHPPITRPRQLQPRPLFEPMFWSFYFLFWSTARLYQDVGYACVRDSVSVLVEVSLNDEVSLDWDEIDDPSSLLSALSLESLLRCDTKSWTGRCLILRCRTVFPLRHLVKVAEKQLSSSFFFFLLDWNASRTMCASSCFQPEVD